MDEAQQASGASIKVPLFSAGRERTGDLELSAAVFGRTGHNSLLHEAVRMQLAKRRAGTAATKTKGLVAGGGKVGVGLPFLQLRCGCRQARLGFLRRGRRAPAHALSRRPSA